MIIIYFIFYSETEHIIHEDRQEPVLYPLLSTVAQFQELSIFR